MLLFCFTLDAFSTGIRVRASRFLSPRRRTKKIFKLLENNSIIIRVYQRRCSSYARKINNCANFPTKKWMPKNTSSAMVSKSLPKHSHNSWTLVLVSQYLNKYLCISSKFLHYNNQENAFILVIVLQYLNKYLYVSVNLKHTTLYVCMCNCVCATIT